MTHLVVFDIDGTLTETTDMDTHCYVRAMGEHLGCTIDDDWSHYEHVTDSGIANELLRRHERDPSDAAVIQRSFIALLLQSLTANPEACRAMQGANSLLRRLRRTAGVVIGLATGAWAESARIKLRHAKVEVDGLAFASASDAESRAEIMTTCERRAAFSEGVKRFGRVTYVGDGIWDAHASKLLGWGFVGIGSGLHAEQLRKAGASHVFEDFNNQSAVLRALDVIGSVSDR